MKRAAPQPDIIEDEVAQIISKGRRDPDFIADNVSPEKSPPSSPPVRDSKPVRVISEMPVEEDPELEQ